MSKQITLIKSDFTKTGGAEKYARRLAQAFHEKDSKVRILTSGPIEQDYPFEVVSTHLKSRTSVSKVWEFIAFCQEVLQNSPTEIIFSLDRTPFSTHMRASSGVHKAYLMHRKHSESPLKHFRHMLNPLHSSLLHIERKGIENPDLKTLFTNSHLVKEEVLTHFVIDESQLKVIHNGVEWSEWETPFSTWQENHDPTIFTFLFIGSNFARKGLKPLLHGLALLPHKDWKLLVVGRDKNASHFQHLAQKLGIRPNVHFEKEQSDTRPYLQKSDCLVIPSYYDPFANVTVEALAMGLYVVSSKTNGGCEVLSEETGTIIEDLHSDESVKTALEKALTHPKTLPSANRIRQSAKTLDFNTQLSAYIEETLS